jgi:hypothetical protein
VVVARGKHGNIQELWHTGTEQEECAQGLGWSYGKMGWTAARSWAADTVSVETERSPYRSHPARGSLVGDMHGTARGLARLWFCEAVWDLLAQIISGLRALEG